MSNSKSIPKRRTQLPCPCSCPNQRKLRQFHTYTPSRRPFPNKNIQFSIFHRRIQNFLHRCIQSMNFINKQNVIFLQRRQNSRQISRLFQHRSSRYFQIHSHFCGNNSCKCSFSQSWRPI